jgi:two-component system, OmpR family, sensor histidine kinase KdpD
VTVAARVPGTIVSLRVRRELAGLLAGALAVAVVTIVIWLLKPYIPVLSLGALYVLGVLPIALVWGLPYAIAVSVASMLAFNWFFLPPVHTFTLEDSRNWFALAVFVATGVVVSELAARLRRQARQSSLLAEIATSLLEHGDVSEELDRIAAEAARALEVERATITLGPQTESPEGAEAHALGAGGRRLGTIYLAGRRRGSAGARRRLLPGLASLLGVAIDRERLAGEAVEAEALRRSDAIKTALLRTVSHDLRTPLMGILASASALAQRDLTLDDTDRAELLDTVLDEAHRLDKLVGNLLDLSRLQAGAARPEVEIAVIDDLVVEALDELGADGARVEVTLADEPAAVPADSHQIQRALVNLIENALKYSPLDAPVHVRVTVTSSEVAVRVIDQGPGVATRELERIFEPFQRGSGSGAVRGAGLGLAIAQGFVEANGGRISVESRAGQGATFVLTLPVAKVAVEA